MLPTPSTSHVNFDNVYEPAEDSYLLLDTLSSVPETSFLRQRFNVDASEHQAAGPHPGSLLVLEVGVGSGVVLAFAAANAELIFGRNDILTLGTDINSFACKAASMTVRSAIKNFESTVSLDVINGDLAAPIRPSSVDVLIFNPPYVPAELPDLSRHHDYNVLPPGHHKTSFDQDSYLLSLSYAGGVDGMEVTNRMLEQIPSILHPIRGVAYVLLCAQNKPEEVKQRIMEWGSGWVVETVGLSGKQAGWEKLQIVRIWRNSE